MKHQTTPILMLVATVAALTVVVAGGPVLWAIAVMGLPFIAGMVILGGLGRTRVDNGHFRRPGDDKA